MRITGVAGLRTHGFEAKPMAPQLVEPYVKSKGTVRNDAGASCEAAKVATMRFVPFKSVEQQDSVRTRLPGCK